MTTVGRVSLVVLTYRRPDDLAALLPALEDHLGEFSEDLEILVIDNDDSASARGIVDDFASARVRYVHEPAPGIAHARNRALDETAGSRLLVFIDDDERPTPGWLSSMLATYSATSPAGVTGPLYPDYEVSPDPWLVAGGFFVRKNYPAGHLMPAAGTGNLLLDLDQVRRHQLRFDERFGMTGGSDTLFTRTLIRAGGRIVWAPGAGLVDKVPASRMTRQWVLNRQFRFGNTWSRTSLELARPGRSHGLTRGRLTLQGSARVAYGVLRLAQGTLQRSVNPRARGLRAIYRGAGMVAGAWGSVYQEYRRSGSSGG